MRHGSTMTERLAHHARSLSALAAAIAAALLVHQGIRAASGAPVDWTVLLVSVSLLLSGTSDLARIRDRSPRLAWGSALVQLGVAFLLVLAVALTGR